MSLILNIRPISPFKNICDLSSHTLNVNSISLSMAVNFMSHSETNLVIKKKMMNPILFPFVKPILHFRRWLKNYIKFKPLITKSVYSSLHLAPCEVNERPCNDGVCIHEKFFCDSFFDCSDGSDEMDCKYKYKMNVLLPETSMTTFSRVHWRGGRREERREEGKIC